MKQGYVYKPVKFFTITFLITWICLFIAAYCSYQKGMELYQLIFSIPSLLAPTIAVLIMIFGSKNNELKKDFLDRMLNFKRIKFGFVPVIFLLLPAVVILSMLLSTLFGRPVSQLNFFEELSFTAAIIPASVLLVTAPLLEELGWRGYAMDSLCSKFNVFTATVIFGILWGVLWHLPLYFVKGYYQNELWNENIIFAVNFMVSVLVLSFLLSWVYYRNNRSIIACVLFHLVTNLSAEAFRMEQFAKCIETVVLLVIAIIIVIKNKKLFFKEKHNIFNQPKSAYTI